MKSSSAPGAVQASRAKMRPTHARFSAVTCQRRVLLAMVAAAGCFPSGSAPTGRHLISDRTLSGVHFSPSETDGVPSFLLATGPVQDLTAQDLTVGGGTQQPSNVVQYTVADLYQIVAGTAGGAVNGSEVAKLFGKCLVPHDDPARFALQTDSQGRLLVVSYLGPTTSHSYSEFIDLRIDLATGQRYPLMAEGAPSYEFPEFYLSPGRTRIFIGRDAAVCELNGEQSWLGGNTNSATFVGEDLYYAEGLPPIYQTPDIWRLVPYGQPELLHHDASLWTNFSTDRGPRLILARQLETEDGMIYHRYSVFDPATQQELPIPPGGVPGWTWGATPALASADGHWLVLMGDNLTLFNWVTSETQTIDDVASTRIANWEWRPGRDELWVAVNDGTGRIWKPDVGVTTMPVEPLWNVQAPSTTLSSFTRDGSYWFSVLGPQDAPSTQAALYVGLADDPSGPVYQVTPAGALVESHWELADGRVMAGAWTTYDHREDYYIVDPRTGASQSLALNGLMVAVGQTRALAFVNWETGLGSADLCLIDLATGGQTLLAENVYAADVDPGTHTDVPAGSDALAPGTRVAFLVRNRIDSPYDGLWVVELP